MLRPHSFPPALRRGFRFEEWRRCSGTSGRYRGRAIEMEVAKKKRMEKEEQKRPDSRSTFFGSLLQG